MLAAAASAAGLLILAAGAHAVSGRTAHGTLEIQKVGNGQGKVKSDPSGVDCGDVCVAQFPSNGEWNFLPIVLEATPKPGHRFLGFSGDCTDSDNDCILREFTASGLTVKAHFEEIPPPTYPVNAQITGNGSLTSEPAGISCPPQCAANPATGSTVKLTAKPAPTWKFVGWGGSCSGVEETCELKIDKAHNVSATFEPPLVFYALAVSTSKGGSITSDFKGFFCRSNCVGVFRSGTAVKLMATGKSFGGWTGACTGREATCTVTITGPKALSAHFGKTAPKVPLAVGVTGKGTITDSGKISCSKSCGVYYDRREVVELTAKPRPGWRFAGWGGTCAGVDPTCKVTAESPRTATAFFVSSSTRFFLSLETSGRGRVTSKPSGIACGARCTARFVPGTMVRLEAEPPAGWALTRWSGACTGSAETCSVAMKGHESVSATFAELNDKQAPKVEALPSTGGAGETVRLRYRVRDDSDESLEYAKVYKGKQELAEVRGTLDDIEPGVLFYFLSWKAPETLAKGSYRFCVWAEDRARNRAGPSCASLKIT